MFNELGGHSVDLVKIEHLLAALVNYQLHLIHLFFEVASFLLEPIYGLILLPDDFMSLTQLLIYQPILPFQRMADLTQALKLALFLFEALLQCLQSPLKAVKFQLQHRFVI